MRASGLSLAPSAVPGAPALCSPALTGLRESRARAGAGERGPGSTSARRPPAGLFPKLPQQAKSMRADLSRGTKALSAGAPLCPRCSPTSLRFAALPRILFILLPPDCQWSSSSRLFQGAGLVEEKVTSHVGLMVACRALGHPGCLADLRSTGPLK